MTARVRTAPFALLALFACGAVACDGGGDAKGSSTGGKSDAAGGLGGAGGSGGAGGAGGSSLQLANFQPADTVIGQPDFTTNAAPTAPGAATTDSPSGSAAFDGTKLWFSDTYTHRALGFSSLPATNGAAASLVLGQSSPTLSAAGTTASTWYLPQTLHVDGTTLAVADAGNHRVLLLPTSAANGAAANVVVGWASASAPSQGCAADRLRSPASAFIGGGKLLVADRGNNRVLIWNSVPTADGTPADLVLGQGSLTRCAANDSQRNGTVGVRSASTLFDPTDVWTDGTRIIVADRGNNRLLSWSSFPGANGAAADIVIGQTDFSLARNAAAAGGLMRPAALTSAGGKLFVADAGHNRVLVWNSLPSVNGAPADVVLGQSNFTRSAPNDDAQSGTEGMAPTARTLSHPSGVAVAGSALVVSDTLNRRVLVFRSR